MSKYSLQSKQVYVCMYIFISGIEPIEQHTDTLY